MQFDYTYYPGSPQFFVQDNNDGTNLPVLPRHFGLMDGSDDRWSTFWKKIAQLNADGKAQRQEYKVFFLGKHGESVHNVASAKHSDWYNYWSHRYTDGILTWGPDPNLTYKGYCDAVLVHLEWEKELQARIGLPQTVYCSPLTRALCTNALTFHGLDGYESKHTVVVENCRERATTQTPEQRRSKLYIQKAFPDLSIEPGFVANDLLWDFVLPETGINVQRRVLAVLDEIFSYHDGPFVSITTHGGFIDAFCRTVGRMLYDTKPGDVLPIVVRKSEVDSVPLPPLQPGTYAIYSVTDPRLVLSVVGKNGPSAIPEDFVITEDAVSCECRWDVSFASEGRYYIRVYNQLRTHIATETGVHLRVCDAKEVDDEYVIESVGMGCFKICDSSTHSAFTFNGRRKKISVTPESDSKDSQRWYASYKDIQKWYFEAVRG